MPSLLICYIIIWGSFTIRCLPGSKGCPGYKTRIASIGRRKEDVNDWHQLHQENEMRASGADRISDQERAIAGFVVSEASVLAPVRHWSLINSLAEPAIRSRSVNKVLSERLFRSLHSLGSWHPRGDRGSPVPYLPKIIGWNYKIATGTVKNVMSD